MAASSVMGATRMRSTWWGLCVALATISLPASAAPRTRVLEIRYDLAENRLTLSRGKAFQPEGGNYVVLRGVAPGGLAAAKPTLGGKDLGQPIACPDPTAGVEQDALCFDWPGPALKEATEVTATLAGTAGTLSQSTTLSVAPPAPADPPPAQPPRAPPAPPPAPTSALHEAYAAGLARAPLSKDRRVELLEEEPHHVYEDHVTAQDVAVLFFDDSGKPLWPLPQVDEDDTLVVVVLAVPGNKLGDDLRITACGAADPVRVAGSAAGVVERTGTGAEARDMQLAVAKACSSEEGLRISGSTRAAAATSSTPFDIRVPTLALNRATVGLGLVFDFSLQREYRTVAVKGEAVPVISEDTHRRGLVPPIPLVALRPAAVDTARVRRWHQAFAPVIGISIPEPTDHLYLGILIEPLPGLGLVHGIHLHREPVLAGGFAVNDRVPGGTFTTDKRWAEVSGSDAFVGLYVDASNLAKVLKVIQ